MMIIVQISFLLDSDVEPWWISGIWSMREQVYVLDHV